MPKTAFSLFLRLFGDSSPIGFVTVTKTGGNFIPRLWLLHFLFFLLSFLWIFSFSFFSYLLLGNFKEKLIFILPSIGAVVVVMATDSYF
jgi:hypothetical protein